MLPRTLKGIYRNIRSRVFVFLCLLLIPAGLFSQVTIWSNASGGGDWSDTLSWAGYVIPGISDTAVIVSGDVITVDSSNTSVAGVVIEPSAQILQNNNNLSIYGDYLNHGQHIAYGNDRIYFRGAGTLIDGSGVVNNTGRLRILDGDKTFPASADLTFGPGEVRVGSNLTATNYGNLNFTGAINGWNAASTWINEAGSRVDVGTYIFSTGTLVANSTGNTVHYYRSGADFNLTRTSDSAYYHLEISGSNLKRLTGPTTILGDLTLQSRLTTQEWPLDLKGNYTNTSTITSDSSRITFSGNGDQTISNAAGENFYSLRVNKPSGSLILGSDLTVTDTLWMDAGDINCQSFTLQLGNSGAASPALVYSDGRILGKFKRWISDTGVDILLPSGIASVYRPVVLYFNDLSSGMLMAEFIASNPGTAGLPLVDGIDTIYNVFTEGYWDLNASEGLASSDYDVQLGGTGFSSFDTDSARVLKRPSAGSPWVLDGNHLQASGDTARRTGLSGFSQFAFGAPDSCDAPVTSAIVGLDEVCINDAGEAYSVTNTPGSTYAWTITGGTQASGGSSNSISVDWGAAGMAGEIQVIESNACAAGVPVTLDVDIHPLATSDIAGPPSVPAGATGMEYSVTSQVGYTYSWVITGGTLVSGDGTPEVVVDWGAAGAGSVQVTATHSCGSAAPVVLNVSKYAGISSVQTGDWDDPTTWDCNCIPASSDNIVISSGDSVSLVASTTIQNLHIESGATLYQPDLNLIIQGDYRVDGVHAGIGGAGSDNIYLDGVNTEISGTGTITNSSRIRMRFGNKTIPAGTSLSKPGGENYVEDNVVVTNYGEITFGYRLFAANTTSVWINEEGSTLNAGGYGSNGVFWRGNLVASAPNNTVNILSTEAQNIKVPASSTYYHLIVGGGNTKTQIGDLVVLGDLSISSVVNAGTYQLNLAGDWSNTGVFNAGSGTVVFDGSEDQGISNSNSESFFNLDVQKAAGQLILANEVHVSNALNLNGGNVQTGSNKLVVGTGVGNVGSISHSAGSVVGQLERWVAATGTDVLFPVGTAQWYRPLQINFNALSGGSLIAEFHAQTPGNQGLPLTDGAFDVNNTFSEGYWSLTTANSLVSGDFDLDLIANGFTSFPISAETRLLSRSASDADWTASGSHVAASMNTISRDNVGILTGQYAVGDTANCTPPVTSSISGSTSVCRNATGESYSVTLNAGSTYEWTVTGGFIMSGQGSNSIVVTWGSEGMMGQVEVRESSACGTGEAVSLDVEIHPFPTAAIFGRSTAYAGESGLIYHVTEQPGYTYSWQVSPEGSIVGSSVNDSITVDWSSAGAATVQVTATHTSCGLSADPLVLDVTVSDIILSAGSGDWENASTWIGGVVPGQYTSARIQNGHTVTVNASPTRVNDLIIDEGAVLNSQNYEFYVYGDYTINGIHQGTGNDHIELRGDGGLIDGTGTVENTGWFIIATTGNRMVAETADITFTNGLRVNNNMVLTNLGSIRIGNDLIGSGANATWINGENSLLEAIDPVMTTGILIASAPGNTVRYDATFNNHNIKVPQDGTYYNLEIAGSTIKTLAGGDLLVLGDLTISSTFSSGDNNISVEGDWINSDGFTPGTGEVRFIGTGDQTISNPAGETFHDLLIQKESGVLTLSDNVNVSNTLSLVQGDVNAGSSILYLGTDAANEGSLAYTSGRIIGSFARWIEAASTGTDIVFPVGVSGVTRSATVNFTNLSAGTLTARFVATNPGNNGLPLEETGDSIGNAFSEGYWILEQGNGLASTNYDLSLNGAGFSSFPFDSEVRILKRPSGASPWILDGSHVAPTGTVASRSTLNGFSEFALGSSSTCSPPVTSLITGSSSVCTNDAGVAYSVVDNPGSTYSWTITGGVVSSGAGTSSITVDWGAAGMAGQVEVIENNGCADGVPVSLDVTIHPLPTSTISGPPSVAAFSTGTGYSVVNTPGYTYNWTITGGSLASGAGTSAVTVDWGAAGSGDVQVISVSTGGCGSASPANLPITKFSAIRSIQSGDFTDPATWDCNCDPPSMSNIVVDSGHVVTLTRADSANNLTIAEFGVLDNQGFRMVVFNDYAIYGTHTGNAGTGTEQLRLQGVGSTIDGTGLISMTGRVYCLTGSKTVLPTADIIIPNAYFYLGGNVVLTNQGTMTVNYLFGAGTNSIWVNDVNSTLNAGGINTNPVMQGGILVANADGNTVNLTYGGAQNIVDPSGHTFYHLTVGGGNNKTLQNNVTVLGDLNISSTLLSNNYNIDLAGDWINAGVYTPGTGAVVLNGTTDQSLTKLTGEVFNDLSISKASGDVLLGGKVTVSGTLTMGGGDIICSDNSLVIGTGTGNTGALSYVTGKVVGTLERWVNTTGTDLLFPIGTANDYRPAVANFNSLTGGSLIAGFTGSNPGNQGLPLDDAGTMVYNSHLEGYWTLDAANSLVSSDFDLSLTGNGFTSFTITPQTRLLSRTGSGADWSASGSHMAGSGNTVQRSGIAILSGEYALGDTINCSPPVTSSITGPTSVCINELATTYSVVNQGGSTYDWTVTGGSIVSGQGSSIIQVNWGSTGMIGLVEVIESNACSEGERQELMVDIGPVPTSAISGPTSVGAGSSGTIYLVQEETGYTYTWSVSSHGTLASPNGDDSIAIDWNTAGSATVEVTASDPGCGASADRST
jgi:hypothetical protein